MNNDENLLQRIRGVIVGGAIGDAMGMPTELWTQHMINQTFENGIQKLIGSIHNPNLMARDMQAGEITDDTINTLLIIDTITASKGDLNVDQYIQKLTEWTENSELSAYVSGPSTLKALEQIKQGVPISETGRFGTTNGASMKIAPVGIISDYNDMNRLVENVYQICLPTHNTGIAIAGASAVAAIISYVTEGGDDLDTIWDIAYEAIDMGMRKGYDLPGPSLKYRIESAKEIVENNNLSGAKEKLYDQIGTGVETVETIPSVLAVVTMAAGRPMEAAKISASLGGDTDTIGAISAAICGGMNQQFDQTAVDQIERVNNLYFNDIAKEILYYSPYYSK
ncbi:ADP-ribosylglycohydrolase family protein [Oceanobacillus jeddahense]|uniref:ADP-ribosylglycohydrolase family protein n=1 Tax=Oceanobacillus jeddahense TaxID=1462527 RepID=A0ABY5JU32_9BACI|nr:ADP-ribosylglycohydrolase family protein [Oceanobacillus jeddahense]UUI03674.1 ADP-ribosylglycohydrolase family protein [Oceanobacillus jeddahense]